MFEASGRSALRNGIAFDGNRFVGTGATAAAFNYLREIRTGNEGLVDLNSASWNQIANWLRQLAVVERNEPVR